MPLLGLASLPISAALVGALVLFAFPLIPLAFVTSILAVMCLAARAAWIYAELAGAVVRQQLLYGGSDPAPISMALTEYSLKSAPRPPSSYFGPHNAHQQYGGGGSAVGSRRSLHSVPSTSSLIQARRHSTPYIASGNSPPSTSHTTSQQQPASTPGATHANAQPQQAFYSLQQGNASNASGLTLATLDGSGGGPRSGGGNSFQDRDYEGVGGWRDADDEDTDADAQWTSMNRRLELPAGARTPGGSSANGSGGGGSGGRPGHRRSLTGGSIRLPLDRGMSSLSLRGLRRGDSMIGSISGSANSAGAVNPPKSLHGGSTGGGSSGDYNFLTMGTTSGGHPGYSRSQSHSQSHSQRASGRATPEEGGSGSPNGGLNMMKTSRSMVDMEMNVGRARVGERRKSGGSSGSGSVSSSNSQRTVGFASGGQSWMAP